MPKNSDHYNTSLSCFVYLKQYYLINMHRILFFLALLSFPFLGQAQKTIQPKGLEYEYKGIVYNKERAYNLTLHTNGFRVGLDMGKLLTYYKTRFYHISLGYLTHPLEERQNKNTSFEGLGASRSFTFGKQNSLYLLRGGVGVKKYKSEKAKRKGVAVGWSYEVGPVIGILKPTRNIYLVDLNGQGLKSPVEITYKDDPEQFLDYSALFGRSDSYDSWAQLAFRPGIQAKVGAHFSFGAFEEFVRAAEIGLMVDYFGVKVPVIIENEAHSNDALFMNLYLTFQFGRRK